MPACLLSTSHHIYISRHICVCVCIFLWSVCTLSLTWKGTSMPKYYLSINKRMTSNNIYLSWPVYHDPLTPPPSAVYTTETGMFLGWDEIWRPCSSDPQTISESVFHSPRSFGCKYYYHSSRLVPHSAAATTGAAVIRFWDRVEVCECWRSW